MCRQMSVTAPVKIYFWKQVVSGSGQWTALACLWSKVALNQGPNTCRSVSEINAETDGTVFNNPFQQPLQPMREKIPICSEFLKSKPNEYSEAQQFRDHFILKAHSLTN